MMDSKVVFIVGSGHSGSTLLTMVLGAHSQVCALSEITWFDLWVQDNKVCSCTQTVRSCPLWSQVLSRITSQKSIPVQNVPSEFPIDLSGAFDRTRLTQKIAHLLSIGGARLLPNSLWRQLIRHVPFLAKVFERTQNAYDFYKYVREVTGQPVLVDASKSVYRLLHIYQLQPEGVYAIYLTRDGRAVVNSLTKHNGYSAKTAALRWRMGNRYSKWMLGRLPQTRKIHIRYEELCHDPHSTIQRLCQFIGIEFESAMLNFRLSEHHLIGGNGMRFEGEASIVENVSWRSQMPEEALGTFEKIGGRLNRQLSGEYFRE